MAENKTKKTRASVTGFLRSIKDPAMRADCNTVAKMMRAATGKNARMWGSSIVGFGTYDYKYESGRDGQFFLCGFSPRAKNLTIYIMPGFSKFQPLMKKLGPHKTGKSCLYVKHIADIDRATLHKLIEESVKVMRKKYPTD